MWHESFEGPDASKAVEQLVQLPSVVVGLVEFLLELIHAYPAEVDDVLLSYFVFRGVRDVE